jgi:hypothetical protein
MTARLTLCLLLAAASAHAQDRPLLVPTSVYVAAAGADVTTTLLCPPPRCRETNQVINWLEPRGQVPMLAFGSALDAAGVWAWNRYVGRKHPTLAKVGLYVGAGVRSYFAVHNLRSKREADRLWRNHR